MIKKDALVSISHTQSLLTNNHINIVPNNKLLQVIFVCFRLLSVNPIGCQRLWRGTWSYGLVSLTLVTAWLATLEQVSSESLQCDRLHPFFGLILMPSSGWGQPQKLLLDTFNAPDGLSTPGQGTHLIYNLLTMFLIPLCGLRWTHRWLGSCNGSEIDLWFWVA